MKSYGMVHGNSKDFIQILKDEELIKIEKKGISGSLTVGLSWNENIWSRRCCLSWVDIHLMELLNNTQLEINWENVEIS